MSIDVVKMVSGKLTNQKKMTKAKKYTQSLFNFSKPKTKKTMEKIVKIKTKKYVSKKKTTTKKVPKTALKKLPAKLKGKATLAQLNKARKTGKSVSVGKARQTGSSSKYLDKRKTALAPGKRLTPSGNIYYENRKNRSDKKGFNL